MSNSNSPANLNPPENPGPSVEIASRGSMLQFLLSAAVIAAGLSIAAAHAPVQIRLLGPFSVGFGLLLGWLLTRMAVMLNLRLRAPHFVLVGLMALGGLIGSACQTVALQPEPPPQMLPHPVAEILAAKMREESGIKPGEAIPEITPIAAAPPSFGNRFQQYLHRRVKKLGAWPSPWPELFWVAELLAGTASAVGIAIRLQRQEPRP